MKKNKPYVTKNGEKYAEYAQWYDNKYLRSFEKYEKYSAKYA